MLRKRVIFRSLLFYGLVRRCGVNSVWCATESCLLKAWCAHSSALLPRVRNFNSPAWFLGLIRALRNVCFHRKHTLQKGNAASSRRRRVTLNFYWTENKWNLNGFQDHHRRIPIKCSGRVKRRHRIQYFYNYLFFTRIVYNTFQFYTYIQLEDDKLLANSKSHRNHDFWLRH